MTSGGRARGPARADAVLALLLLVGSVCYVAALPRVLGGSDEGIYLYEAKRLLEGQVFYRDIFDLITPGAHYLMAGAYALLGTSFDTARRVDAAVQGLIVAATFAACRRLGVRPALAAAAGLAQLTVFQPAWPVASPHWLATLLAVVLVVVLLGRPDARHGFGAGLVAGLLIAVQQQKGIALTTGAAAFLVAERVLVLRGEGAPWRIAAFVGALLLVIVPFVAFLVHGAGAGPVLQALVVHPLFNYPRLNRTRWGSVGLFPWNARYTFPTVLAVAPSLAAVDIVRTALARERGEPFRQTMLLGVVALASIGSVLYYPDYIHLAFIGPVFAVIAAELAERALGATWVRGRLARAAAGVLPTLLLGASAFQLERVMAGSWRDFPFGLDTPFGHMQFHERKDVDLIERVRRVLARSPSGELFVYPFGAGFYLITGTSNPTPFQFLLPGYSRPDQLDLATGILEEHRVPYVIVIIPAAADDPVMRYVTAHFEQVDDGSGPLPLFRRRAPAAPP